MQIEKNVVTSLEKCYALAEIRRDGATQYLVASEKQYACIAVSEDGRRLDTVWEGPGGVMTLEPLEGGNGAFLATHRFYSPNDSAQASIVYAHPQGEGWAVSTLWPLPFVHRFGLLRRDGRTYIAAATLKSAHAFRDDWTCPGRVWVGELPGDLEHPDREGAPALNALVSGLTKNHGFFKYRENGYECALIGSENGVYKIAPPAAGGEWTVEQLLDVPTSDIALADFDGDGEDELLVFSPFHGDQLAVYKRQNGTLAPVWHCPEQLPFLHAIGVCTVAGQNVAVIGNRKGDRDILLLDWQDGAYRTRVIDHNVGSANVLCRAKGDKLFVLAANREIDEVAMYHVSLE